MPQQLSDVLFVSTNKRIDQLIKRVLDLENELKKHKNTFDAHKEPIKNESRYICKN